MNMAFLDLIPAMITLELIHSFCFSPDVHQPAKERIFLNLILNDRGIIHIINYNQIELPDNSIWREGDYTKKYLQIFIITL